MSTISGAAAAAAAAAAASSGLPQIAAVVSAAIRRRAAAPPPPAPPALAAASQTPPLALEEPRSGPRVEVKVCSKVASMKSSEFEVARESLETVPSRGPGVGAPPLGRDGPAPPPGRAAGALAQFCRQTGRAKNWRGSGTGGTPGRIWTDYIVWHRGGEPPRAHRRAGRRSTRPRRQRGESCSRGAADMAVATAEGKV